MAVAGRMTDVVATLDAARFTGRRAVLDRMDVLLEGTGAERVVLVHGPGGIGKSALLREVGRRAAAAARRVVPVDGRALEPLPGELERALRGALELPGAVVLVDSFERIRALDGVLRDRVLPGLAADALIFIAGRLPPERAWYHGGWEHVVREVALGPLPRSEARELLATLGVSEAALVREVVDWAGGSPLALTVAVDAALAGSLAGRDLESFNLNRMIVDRLAGDELGRVDADVLEVAAVARAVDARLLAAALPGQPTREAYRALRASSVAELVGGRVTLHDLVRGALRDELRQGDGARYGRLRCRVADHLLDLAATGRPRLLLDLLHLVDEDEVRWGIGGDAHDRVRLDAWQPGDAGIFADPFVASRGGPLWDSLAVLLGHAPELGLVARDLGGAPLGFCVATAARDAPPAAWDDPVTRPLLADAERHRHDHAMVFRESFRLPGVSATESFGVLHLSAVLRSGLPDVTRSYILDTAPNEESRAFFEAVGASRAPRLEADLGGRPVACWVVEHGPGGMLAQVRDVIYAEAGEAAPGPAQRREEELHRAAMDALRGFTRPEALAANPLAAGRTVGELRQVVRRAVGEAFGDGATDRLQKEVVALADLDGDATHDQAAARLAVSRATYFRHLRRGREKVVAAMLDAVRPGSAAPA